MKFQDYLMHKKKENITIVLWFSLQTAIVLLYMKPNL